MTNVIRRPVRMVWLAIWCSGGWMAAVGQPQEAVRQVRVRFETAARQACIDRGLSGCTLEDVTSESISDVNLHKAVLRVGPGPYDLIRVNRLVDEQHPAKAMAGEVAVFFIHGTGQTFFDSFINKSTIDTNPGFALWLAQRGIDVWGIDLRFAFVPATTSDFRFMADWDFGVMIRDVMLGTRFARYSRRMTGQHFGKVHLVGRSLGASLALAVANAEAALAVQEQDIGDLIPMDTVYKLAATDTVGRARACAYETGHAAAIAAGTFYIDGRGGLAVGAAAKANPEGPSPVAGLTNKEYALGTACAPIMLPGFPYHSVACLFDARGIPTGGRFSPTTLIIDSLADGIPTRPRATMRDYFGIPCDKNATPYDDNLSAIRIPSFYVGVAGGFGTSGLYTQTLLGSSAKGSLLVRLLPAGQETMDFGHIESFIANDAASLVWEPVLEWILAHEIPKN